MFSENNNLLHNYMSKVKVKLKLHHALKDLSCEQQIVNLIVQGVKEQFPGTNLKALKNSMQLVTDVMNCVENISISKSVKKKDIVIRVFHELFDEDTEDPLNLDLLGENIEYVCNNKMLTKYTMLTNALKLLCKVFLQK
jgi:hypothetical protein